MVTPARVTLSDVASHAGVSVTTASYILNGRSAQMRISEETAARVHAAARELEYRPNRNARNLRLSSTATLGMISAHVASGHYASEMLSGATAAARSHGLLLLIGETEGDPLVEERLIEEMVERRVDGIVYVALATSHVMPPALLRQHRAVLLNCLDPEGRLHSVVPAEYDGGRTAAQVLLDAGQREGIYVVGDDINPFATAGPDRLRGIVHALAQHKVELAGSVPCEWRTVAAYDALMSFLDGGREGREAPRALICLNDRVAMGCYQALAAHGLSVGDDVAVVSFDGSDLAQWLRPTLTSIAIPYYDMGVVAVESLLGSRQGVRRMPMPVVRGRSA